MPNLSGKILVYKQWGVGYQKFNTNEHDKNIRNAHKNTYKEIQIINSTKWHNSIKLNEARKWIKEITQSIQFTKFVRCMKIHIQKIPSHYYN